MIDYAHVPIVGRSLITGDRKMDPQTAEAVKRDFLAWSGGCPPDSDQQIFVYVEYALSIDIDAIEVSNMLKDWMQEEWRLDSY